MNEIMNISGIECYEKDGTAYLKLETVARGLGFTTVATSGNEVVRWNTVYKYLNDLGVARSCNEGNSYRDICPDFIPENIFYRLAMKAKNEAAEKFQAFIADEVIPSIRKHGGYLTPEKVEEALLNPDTLIRLATDLKTERQRRKLLEDENAQQKQLLAEYSPKASYYDVVLQTPDAISTSQIAKDYGKSAKWLNNLLHEFGVQYNQGGIWLLYQKYAEQGYTRSKTHTYNDNDGKQHSKLHTYWTQKGRLFIYDMLKQKRILPVIETDE